MYHHLPLNINVELVHPDAQLPSYADPATACFEIRAVGIPEGVTLEPSSGVREADIPTGLVFDIPRGWMLLLFTAHSAEAQPTAQHCIGVVEPGNTVPVHIRVRLDPQASEPLRIREGQIVARGLIVPCERVNLLRTSRKAQTDA